MVEINAQTKLCGVLGNPVEHSLSPAIHNAAFRKLGLNYVYLAFRVESIGEAVKGLRALGNCRGFSITIPHKVTALPFLDEVETTAKQIGAINTIVVDNGKLTGHNTDVSGALQALQEGEAELTGQRVLMVGSGGAARAIAFALGGDAGIAGLTLLGADENERRSLVQDLRSKTPLSVEEGPLNDDALRSWIPHCRTLIHCTPVGMSPTVDESCVCRPACFARTLLSWISSITPGKPSCSERPKLSDAGRFKASRCFCIRPCCSSNCGPNNLLPPISCVLSWKAGFNEHCVDRLSRDRQEHRRKGVGQTIRS